MNPNIVCDKCGSGNVSDTVPALMEPKNEPVIKMSEFALQPHPQFSVMNAVMVYHRHVLLCKNCGHTEEYTA